MAKFLYGASVQGIQSFIFETNRLKEIVGASEFVEQVCGSFFAQTIGISEADFINNPNYIQAAAGNIRYLFNSREECEKVVRNFPYVVLCKAPGMVLSQAVVEVEGGLTTKDISTLIEKLDEQRNKPQVNFIKSPMIAKRSPQTGHASIFTNKNSAQLSQLQLLKEAYSEKNSLKQKLSAKGDTWTSGDLDYLVNNKNNSRDEWLAIVHADGNNLGKLIMRVNKQLAGTSDRVQPFFRAFSLALNEATIFATQIAYNTVLEGYIKSGELVPFRPVLLGGDDLTVIIKARHALDFTHRFLTHFEEKTKELVSPLLTEFPDLSIFAQGLTSCAGIAYIKPSYPFHYGAELAEKLCAAAKKSSKKINEERSPSCVLFHQVHSSFVGEWTETIRRELTVTKGSFNFGPYFLTKTNGYETIDVLKGWKSEIKNNDAPKSQLRALITEYTHNPASAEQYEKRLRQIGAKRENGYWKKLMMPDSIFRDTSRGVVSPAWDIIKLATIENEKS